MIVGVIGDSHGDIHFIEQAVAIAGNVDLWLHTGDFCRDAQLMASMVDVPVKFVTGNCDARSDAKPDEFMELGGYRIWLTHGHRYGVKQNLDELRYWARQFEADIVVYGHTHQSDITLDSGKVLFNPGSIAMPRRGKRRTFGIMELKSEGEGVFPRLISLP